MFVRPYVCLQISVLLSISSGGIIFLASKGLSLSLQVVLSLCSSVSVTQLLLTRAAATPTTQVSLRSFSSYYVGLRPVHIYMNINVIDYIICWATVSGRGSSLLQFYRLHNDLSL